MSEPRSKAPKRVLPVVGKSLMPEVLPSPLHASNLDASPRARVLKRLTQLSERAAALAAAASISAACSTGGGGGGGGGYMTVDPAPPPAGMGFDQFACPDPAATLFDVSASWEGAGSFHVVVAPSGAAVVANFSIASAIAGSGASAELSAANDVIVTVPGGDLAAWPASVDLQLELRCVDSRQQVSRYVLVLRFDTSQPAPSGSLPFMVVDDADGGT